MFDELLEIVKEFFKKLFSSRLFALSVIFTVMFAGLLGKLFQMQILDGSEYQETYMQRTEKNVTTPGSRGNIYDRNGNRLAYNELAYSVTIQDLGDYPRPSSRNQMLYRLVRILDRRGETVEGKFEIALDQNGEMFFTSSSDSARTRFFLNFYGLSSTASLNDPKGKYPTNSGHLSGSQQGKGNTSLRVQRALYRKAVQGAQQLQRTCLWRQGSGQRAGQDDNRGVAGR